MHIGYQKRKKMIKNKNIINIKNKTNHLTKNYRDVYKICKDLDIIILERPYKKQLGAFSIINNIPFIFIKEDIDINLKQIIIAHEIGHYILHKKIMKNLPILRDYSLFDKRENEIEKEANIFAFFLLIDIAEFEKSIIEINNIDIVAKKFKIDDILKNIYINYIYNK